MGAFLYPLPLFDHYRLGQLHLLDPVLEPQVHLVLFVQTCVIQVRRLLEQSLCESVVFTFDPLGFPLAHAKVQGANRT